MMSLILFGLAGVVLQLGVMLLLLAGQKDYGMLISAMVTLVLLVSLGLCGLLVMGGLTLTASPL